MRFSAAQRNTWLDSTDADWDGALIRIYSAGSGRPATADTAITDQVLLATLTMAGSGAGMGSASGGTKTAGSITGDTAADATGTAAFARIVKADGTTPIGDASVTATGGGGEITFPTVSFVATVAINMSSFAVSIPVGS